MLSPNKNLTVEDFMVTEEQECFATRLKDTNTFFLNE